MSKTLRDKSRKTKVEKFKQKAKSKKRMELPKFKPFRQVPHLEPDSEIKMSGQQFTTLQSFFNVFAEPISVMQDIFGRNLNDGTITIKYVDNEGNEVSKEEVQAYMNEVSQYLASQTQKTNSENSESTEDQPIEETTSVVEVESETPKLKTNKLKVV